MPGFMGSAGQRMRTAGLGLCLLSFVSLSACGAVDSPPISKVQNGQASDSVSAQSAVQMTVWTVPAQPHAVYLQVRLVPRTVVGKAVLTVRAASLRVSPSSFVLKDLRPYTPPPSSHSPPNPPALGITVLRTFRLTAPRAGTYRVVVELEFDGRQHTRVIHITVH